MQDFRKLDAWGKAHLLVLKVYSETQALPAEEQFGMKLQLRRSAMSVPTRIAEGCGRATNPEFAADLRRAVASCNELEYLILLARDLELWKPELSDALMRQAVEVRKMTYGLLQKI